MGWDGVVWGGMRKGRVGWGEERVKTLKKWKIG